MLSLKNKMFSPETMKKVEWAKHMFDDWKLFRNSQEHLKTYECYLDDISTLSQKAFCEAICRFLTKVKKIDGSEFPAKTLYEIVICLQFWIETKGLSWKLISDKEFSDVKFTLDNLMKARTAAGIGVSVRKAEALSVDQEELLWCSGVLGTQNPEILLHTLIYLVGLHCTL